MKLSSVDLTSGSLTNHSLKASQFKQLLGPQWQEGFDMSLPQFMTMIPNIEIQYPQSEPTFVGDPDVFMNVDLPGGPSNITSPQTINADEQIVKQNPCVSRSIFLSQWQVDQM